MKVRIVKEGLLHVPHIIQMGMISCTNLHPFQHFLNSSLPYLYFTLSQLLTISIPYLLFRNRSVIVSVTIRTYFDQALQPSHFIRIIVPDCLRMTFRVLFPEWFLHIDKDVRTEQLSNGQKAHSELFMSVKRINVHSSTNICWAWTPGVRGDEF